MAEPTPEQMLRGLYALAPFRTAYELPLNPEDMSEIVYAVLKHGIGDGPLEQITGAVEQQIIEVVAAQAKMLESMQRSIDEKSDPPPA